MLVRVFAVLLLFAAPTASVAADAGAIEEAVALRNQKKPKEAAAKLGSALRFGDAYTRAAEMNLGVGPMCWAGCVVTLAAMEQKRTVASYSGCGSWH